MKIYLHLLFGLAVLAGLFGFILPWLISAQNSLLVLGGIVMLVVLTPLFIWTYFHRYFQLIIKKNRTGE